MPNFIPFDFNEYPDATDWVGDPIASDLEGGRSFYAAEQLKQMIAEDAAILLEGCEDDVAF